MEEAEMELDPHTSEIVIPASSDIAVRITPADQRRAEHAESHSVDAWARSVAWSTRWLTSMSNTGTRSAYSRAFDSLTEVGEELGVAPIAMQRSDIDRWLSVLKDFGNPSLEKPTPLGSTSLARHLATASAFFKYCIRWPCTDPDHRKDGRDCGAPWVTNNPVPDGDARPKATTQSQQQFLGISQVQAFLAEAEKAGTRAAALAALLTNALRISEIIGSTVTDVGEDRGHRILKVTGKGDKVRRVVLPPAAWKRVEAAIGDRTEGPIIITSNRTPMDRHAAWELVQTLARDAGIKGSVGPHTFRHAAITQALTDGAALADVQDWAGHADSRTTRRYDRLAGDPGRSPAHSVSGKYYATGGS